VDLKISNVRVTSADGSTQKCKEVVYLTEIEVVHFLFDTLSPGNYSLEMDFEGELNDKMKGFYRSKYFSHPDLQERYAAVTQFEATDARRCFPCWDEPALKATFNISMTIPENLVGLSNMPLIDEEKSANGMKTLKFATSPIMSTYCKIRNFLDKNELSFITLCLITVLAMCVGEYDHVEGSSSDGVKVRVYTPVGKKEQGLFALEVTKKVLPYYLDYFKIAYPLPKLDLIAISDFAAGAMEGW